MAACIKLGRQSPINYSKNPTSFNYLYIHKPKPTPKTLKSNPNLEEEQMTGIGSPCGACKFLRRKCMRGCVFAPYFCHEQGAAQFAAVHKVFGASNVSKLLAHLPVTNRPEAAQTLSYEAQARLQDPIYGCVSHIFALQQQVVNLQAQLASLKAQETQCYANGSSSSSSSSQNDYNLRSEFTNFHQFSSSSMNYENGFMSSSSNDYSCQNYEARSYGNGENDSFDMGDLQSVAIAYLNRA